MPWARLHVPDPHQRPQVEAIAGYGIPEAGIARVIGIAPGLREHYRAELDTAQIIAKARIAEGLFRKATGDHRQAVTVAEDAALDRRGRLLSEG